MIFSTLLFLACASFVANRCYDCIKKFLSHPQHVESEYTPSSDETIPFPAMTFCNGDRTDLDVEQLNKFIKIISKSYTVVCNNLLPIS